MFPGNFLHAESNRLQSPGDSGRIKSDVLPSNAPVVCLTFEYKIDGSELIGFRVFQISRDITQSWSNSTHMEEVDNGDDVLLLEETGSSENIWKSIHLEVIPTSDFQV